MKKQKHQLSLDIIKATRAALDKVGEEEFDERGPEEIIDLVPLIEKFIRLTLKEKIEVSSDLKEYVRCSETLSHMLMVMEHELMEQDKEMDPVELKQIVDVGSEGMKENFSELYDSFEGQDS